MIDIFVFLLILEFSLSFKFDLNVYSDKFDLVKWNNQELYHTKSIKDSSKWLIFPLQLDYHSSILKSKSSTLLKTNFKNNNPLKDIDSSLVIHHNDNSFWKTYNKYLNLHEDVEMKLVKESAREASSKKIKQYQQLIYGFQVFGGDYKVTIGAHDGITHIHGHSFPTIDESYRYIQSFADVPESSIKVEEELLKILLKDHMKLNDNNIDSSLNSASNNKEQHVDQQYEIVDGSLELIWFENTSSRLVLVYHYKVNDKLNHESQDIFIDFHSLQVVNIINNPLFNNINDKISKLIDNLENSIQPDVVGTSPFSPSSFSSEVIVANVIPNVVFNSSDPSLSAYPTATDEINMLVDTTLYIKYLIYSLSNSEFITWEKYQRSLLIAYNEPGVANAQFDPFNSGIIFSTGWIATDVIAHEWFHGYTATISGLVYAYQSGAMNEAFSDIIGESIDILTRTSTVLNQKRTIEPTSCIQDSSIATSKRTDKGARWIIGETLSRKGLRDMYKPECYGHPGYFHSSYYVCTANKQDKGGVHSNSGVINHFYAVMVDGGFIREGVKPISGIGLVKALNIFWNAIQELTSLSQFQDFAVALSMTCENMIGEPIYNLNYLDDTITAVSSISELITAKDCRMIDTLIKQSQINLKQSNCPNLVCGDSLISCEYARCSSASDISVVHEEFTSEKLTFPISPACSNNIIEYQSVARVFNQTMLGLTTTAEFYLSCVEFLVGSGSGANDIIVSVYIDKTGGIPDAESFSLVKRFHVKVPNSDKQNMILTTSDDSSSKVLFTNPLETLVVVMEFIVKANNTFSFRGFVNQEVYDYAVKKDTESIPLDLHTYVTGPCVNGVYSSVLSHASDINDLSYFDISQWYVKLTASTTSNDNYNKNNHNNDDSNDDLSDKDIAGLVIGLFFFGIMLGIVCFYLALRTYPTNTSTTNTNNITPHGELEKDEATINMQVAQENSSNTYA